MNKFLSLFSAMGFSLFIPGYGFLLLGQKKRYVKYSLLGGLVPLAVLFAALGGTMLFPGTAFILIGGIGLSVIIYLVVLIQGIKRSSGSVFEKIMGKI
ncbi:MAG: hypothetical protein Q4Q04_02285 [Methanocorpusculum sp.]|nr:hypothetical protein [Methanocorpusculum sp.]